MTLPASFADACAHSAGLTDSLGDRDDNDDEPRQRRQRRCPECRCVGGHLSGCPETPEGVA